MPSATWSSAKAKVRTIHRLSVQRLRTLQQKKEAQAKSSRRDIALLLEKGKIESARIKVEAIINEDINLELLELMELYCELLLARFGLLDQNTREPDPGISEGVCAIIHAAQRTEVKELHVLREILIHKYGREFSAAATENRGGCVSDRVVRKLVVETPSVPLVDGYLTEIAKAYSVKWTPADNQTTSTENGPPTAVPTDLQDVQRSPAAEDASEPLPSYSAERPGIQIPSKVPDQAPTPASEKPSRVVASPKEDPEDEFESLARRFQALKKR
ncbi:DUF292-domain-containing protein [Phlebopus sp. FC_14]|nr:DUF292-domain-containing protein [Phlebopus sp. FC_14]